MGPAHPLVFSTDRATLAIMVEIPGELKPDLQRTLLGPLSLATELFGALIPGSVFLILMCVKLRWVAPILTYTLAGYVTKVVLALLASYVIGKVSLGAINLVSDSVKSLARKLKATDEKPPAANPTALQFLLRAVSKSGPWFSTFLAGLVGASILSNKSDLFHHFTASEAEASFHLNTGLLLITASLVPGDGHFRWLEVGAGAILMAEGVRLTFENSLLMAGSFGMVLNDYLKGHSPEKVVATLVALLKILAKLAKTPAAGSEVPTASSPAKETATETKAETAAVSTPDGASSPT